MHPGRAQPQECLICSGPNPKYKFRCCQKRFCSSKCYKEHDTKACNDEKEKSTTLPQKRPSNDLYNEEDDNAENLKPSHIKRLEASPEVRQWLQSSRLRQVLTDLDGAKPPHRKASFLSRLMCEPEFMHFANTVMTVMGENGDFPVPPVGPSRPVAFGKEGDDIVLEEIFDRAQSPDGVQEGHEEGSNKDRTGEDGGPQSRDVPVETSMSSVEASNCHLQNGT
uniref:HIT-type domain-containing protein n=1 Tax=Chromera velia CCMP2878 TaxID=1169474 RepID=A0A0G4IFE0_9ALVE|eukprot:Cvel_14009.t1-p1 / transcript=Cvel_14009.t1 / gene=Cvel_14009 / organism=Chromera_velia_CCMP2878 / gene_product=Zinc finger HIT domain-containing protein 3, putative / transcript_product=Zinc finger HIT domain-containing protein 3, putative / location=Cvel_scaffold980:39233-40022(-) / protein_length=222 / sequence_SO=supercontig / SO=protein_coding / is_pseudo=false